MFNTSKFGSVKFNSGVVGIPIGDTYPFCISIAYAKEYGIDTSYAKEYGIILSYAKEYGIDTSYGGCT